jgi:hypothetical protein
MYWLQRINQWSLVRNDEGWSCYEHDPDSAKLLGHGWGVLRDWQELPIPEVRGRLARSGIADGTAHRNR